jgi:hypothetical protein
VSNPDHRLRWFVLAIIGVPLAGLAIAVIVFANTFGDPSEADEGRVAASQTTHTILAGSSLVEHIELTLIPASLSQLEIGSVVSNWPPGIVALLVDDAHPALVVPTIDLDVDRCRAGTTCVERYTLTLTNQNTSPVFVVVTAKGFIETGSGGPPVPNSSLTITIQP